MHNILKEFSYLVFFFVSVDENCLLRCNADDRDNLTINGNKDESQNFLGGT